MLNTDRLRMARQSLGMTQLALAEFLGMHPQTVWHWEKGNQNPSGPNLHRLAAILKVDPNYLIGDTDDPKAELRDKGASNRLETPFSETQNDAQWDKVVRGSNSTSEKVKLFEIPNSLKKMIAEALGVAVDNLSVEIRITI